MSKESTATNVTSSYSDAEFWLILASKFEAAATNYCCQNVVLQFFYRDGDQPESWAVLDGNFEGVTALSLLVSKALRRLGDITLDDSRWDDSRWDAWARHLVENDELHPFAYGPWNLTGQVDPERGRVDFEAYLRRQRLGLIEESIAFCRLKAREAQLLLDAQTLVRPPAREAAEPGGATTKRLPKTVNSEVAARRVHAFLERNGGVTAFATSAGTTDRTLRSFRKTGKARRGTLDGIAMAMGTTTDDLMRPE